MASFKEKAINLLEDAEYVHKLREALKITSNETETPEALAAGGSQRKETLSKETMQDIFSVHYKDHLQFKNLKWEELDADLVEEMVEKVVTLEGASNVSKSAIRRKLRDGYNSRRRTAVSLTQKRFRQLKRMKNKKSYLTQQKRDETLKNAIEEGAVDPSDQKACEDFRRIISPYKGEIVIDDSSDEDIQAKKKKQKENNLKKARQAKKIREDQKRDFILQKQVEFEAFCNKKGEESEESSEEMSESEYPPTPQPYGGRVRKSLFY